MVKFERLQKTYSVTMNRIIYHNNFNIKIYENGFHYDKMYFSVVEAASSETA